MTRPPLVVVGASAGGIPALKTLLAGLPGDLPAAVLIVLHLAPDAPSVLPEILGRAGPLPARHPRDGEPLRPGQVYVAPPDHHLVVDGDGVAVTRGPRENRFRPSVDALFRSAAYTRGADVIGIVLSGLLDDGASGLYTVKRRGGLAVVQLPEDAEFDSMPVSALRQVEVDHVVPARDMGPLLTRLVRDLPARAGGDTMSEQEERRLEIEVAIAREENAFGLGVTRLGEPSLLTCPECHGGLVQFEEGGLLRFRCHTGHAYTGDALLSELTKSAEARAYQVVRTLEESVMLMRRLGEQCEKQGDFLRAQTCFAKAGEAEDRAARVRLLALSDTVAVAAPLTAEPGDD